MIDAVKSADALDAAAARRLATAYDADDAPLGVPAAPVRLPDHDSLASENTGGIRFEELLGGAFHPEPPQDRIAHPWLSPGALDAAAAMLIATLPNPVGRHNRYRPVPGEDGLRTDDLLDFVAWYGHEYQVIVLRAVDVRTASLLDVERLTRACLAVGASVMWDWTGALDWVAWPPPGGVAAVFWSAHSSLIDGRRVEAGVWREGDPAPAALTGRPLVPSVAARAARLAGFAARAFAGAAADADVRVLHPAASGSAIPVLVLEAPAGAGRMADAMADGPGFRAVVRHGERIVALPDAAAPYAAMIDRAADAAAVVRS